MENNNTSLSNIINKIKYDINKFEELNTNNNNINIKSKKVTLHEIKENIQYLKKVTPVPSENMIAFIKFRENLNKSKEFENDLNNKLSKYFFHYHPNTEDINLQNNISDKINLKFTGVKL